MTLSFDFITSNGYNMVVLILINDRQQSENKRIDLFEGANAENDYDENVVLASCKLFSSSLHISVVLRFAVDFGALVTCSTGKTVKV